MPKISILVPVCNVEAYLEQCLDSLINQTFQDFEMICVDDGSTDKSGQILDRYAVSDSRIQVIHKVNTGYGNSMNVALDHAVGDYIAILESDDFAEPDMLQILYDTAVKQDVDVVKADYYHYSDGKDVFCNHLRNEVKRQILRSIDNPRILNLADSIWSCLYKHSFLSEHGIRFHEMPGASYQDISFSIQVWLHTQSVYFIDNPVLHYRRDNPGASMNNPAKLFCVFDEYEWIEEKYKDFWQDHPILEHYFVASKYRDYFSHYYRVGVQYQYALLCRLNESFRNDRMRGRVLEEAFLPRVWQWLQEMADDLNQFFRKTSKKTEDERLRKCRIENESVYAESFFVKLQSYPQVMVYGAGQVGQRFAQTVIAKGGHVDGFIVTELSGQDKECMGIPIYEVQEISNLAESCAVVIAVTEWMQYELYQNLKRHCFQNIFRVDTIIRQNLMS